MESLIRTAVAGQPLAFNTRDGQALLGAGVFRDVNGQWWSVQGRLLSRTEKTNEPQSGVLCFVKLRGQPEWLTQRDASQNSIAWNLQRLVMREDIKKYRSQDEADEDFRAAHRERGAFVQT